MDNQLVELLIGIQNNVVTINTSLISINNELRKQSREIQAIKEEQQAQRKEIQVIKEEQQEMRKEFKIELKETEKRIMDMHKKDLCEIKKYIDIIAKEVQKHGKILAV